MGPMARPGRGPLVLPGSGKEGLLVTKGVHGIGQRCLQSLGADGDKSDEERRSSSQQECSQRNIDPVGEVIQPLAHG